MRGYLLPRARGERADDGSRGIDEDVDGLTTGERLRRLVLRHPDGRAAVVDLGGQLLSNSGPETTVRLDTEFHDPESPLSSSPSPESRTNAEEGSSLGYGLNGS